MAISPQSLPVEEGLGLQFACIRWDLHAKWRARQRRSAQMGNRSKISAAARRCAGPFVSSSGANCRLKSITFDVVVHYMGDVGGIEALHSAIKTIQLQRIAFVPAQHPDIAPVPEGVDVIHLGGSKKVSLRRFDALRLLIFVLRKG